MGNQMDHYDLDHGFPEGGKKRPEGAISYLQLRRGVQEAVAIPSTL